MDTKTHLLGHFSDHFVARHECRQIGVAGVVVSLAHAAVVLALLTLAALK